VAKQEYMLITSNDYSNEFLKRRRLLLDSCVLNDWATNQRTANILEEAEKTFCFVFCTISMLEVGFGPTTKADMKQVDIAKMIYGKCIKVDNFELHNRDIFLKQSDIPYTRYSYNPNHEEFYAARYKLINLMNTREIKGKKARELSNDALIYSCAWNSRSAVITNNTKDFHLFNELNSERDSRHLLPIFSIDNLEKALTEDVSFPENIKA
jgi:hypothetical protein